MLGSCMASPDRVCMKSLEPGVHASRQVPKSSLNSLVDKLPREADIGAECLFMFDVEESLDTDSAIRFFFILTMAVFSPKFGVWTCCTVDLDDVHRVSARSLVFPFIVKIELEACKVTQSGQRLQTMTTNELAISLASVGVRWRSSLLAFDIPDTDSLLPSLVSGVIEGPTDLSQRTRQRASMDGESELRALHRRPWGDPMQVAVYDSGETTERRRRPNTGVSFTPPAGAAEPAPLDDLSEEYNGGAGEFPPEIVEEVFDFFDYELPLDGPGPDA